jgi:hypothetical protein
MLSGLRLGSSLVGQAGLFLGDLLVRIRFNKVEHVPAIDNVGQNASKESEFDANSCCDSASPMLE